MSQSKIFTTGSMLKVEAQSVTSEAAGRGIEFALDNNLRSYWEPTTTATQTVVLDLQYESELINGIENRDFSSASDWVNVDMFAYNEATDLSLVSSSDNQSCELVAVGLKDGFKPGRQYRLTYDYTEVVAGFTFRTRNSSTDIDTIGSPTAGTGQTLTFTATEYADKLAIEGDLDASGHFDNFSITIMDDRQLVDGYAIWLNNIEEDLAPTVTPRIKLDYSDDNANWTSAYDNTHQSHVTTLRFGRMYLVSSGAISRLAHRYWRFIFASNAIVPQVAALYLLKEHDITAQPDEFPQLQPTSFGGSPSSTPLGNRLVNVGLTTPVQTFTRRWRVVTQAVHDSLKAVFDESLGGALPVILKEGSDAWVCDLLTKQWNPKQIDEGYWEITLQFRTKPWTLPAEVF